MKIFNILSKLVKGDKQNSLLKTRSNLLLLYSLFYAIISFFINFYSSLPIITVYTSVTMFFLFSLLFYISRFKGKEFIAINIALVFAFVIYIPIMWFTNSGIEGGFSFFIFMFGTAVFFVARGKRLIFFLSLFFFMTSLSIILEQMHPEWVFYYESETTKLIDLISSFFLALVAILFFMYYFINQYYLFSGKLKENSLRLEEINKDLQKRIKEREILLREIHHRVKNNLQMISSLLNLQKDSLDDTNLHRLLQVSQDRINTVSIVHELLYKSDSLEAICIKVYINNLVENLRQSLNFDININIETAMIESVIDVDKMIICGLITNELITNSLNHAFDKTEKGNISIIGTSNNREYSILVKDNGKGLDKNIDFKKLDSLGFKLINGLTKQLEGVFEYERINNESIFKLTFNF